MNDAKFHIAINQIDPYTIYIQAAWLLNAKRSKPTMPLRNIWIMVSTVNIEQFICSFYWIANIKRHSVS